MSKRRVLGLSLASVALLAACGNSSKSTTNTTSTSTNKFSVVMLTDGGGVDDKSFNQSAWEGLQAWGKETNRTKGTSGFNYIQPKGKSEYETTIATATKADYNLIVGVGFQWSEALDSAVKTYPKNNFAVIDAVLKDAPNAASIVFAEQESAFLAGVAAAKTTKTNHVGYIGGMESEVLIRFESGFVAGVKSVNKDIKVSRQYVGSFADAATGKILANTMYTNNADVIYAAAGGSGLGVFTAAKEAMEVDSSKQLWVIGVDMDQHKDGEYKTASGETKSVTLTSTLKKVGDAIQKFATSTEKDGFKAGITKYTLKDGGVDLTDGQLSSEVKEEIAKVKKAIIDGTTKVPSKLDELGEYANR